MSLTQLVLRESRDRGKICNGAAIANQLDVPVTKRPLAVRDTEEFVEKPSLAYFREHQPPSTLSGACSEGRSSSGSSEVRCSHFIQPNPSPQAPH